MDGVGGERTSRSYIHKDLSGMIAAHNICRAHGSLQSVNLQTGNNLTREAGMNMAFDENKIRDYVKVCL